MTTQRAKTQTVLIIAAAVLVAAAVFVLLYVAYRAEAANHRQAVEVRGETVLDALYAGLRAQTRMGRYREDRLAATFEELASTPDILAITLFASSGEPVAGAGDDIPTDALPPPHVTRWANESVVMTSSLFRLAGMGPGHGAGAGPGMGAGAGLGMGPGMGRGPGAGRGPRIPAEDISDWAVWGDEGYYLMAVMDARPALEHIARAGWLFGGMAGAAGICIALGAFGLAAALRQHELRSALLLAREEAAHHQRLTQLGAGLAHETKNPLGIVRGLAQSIGETPKLPLTAREAASAIVDESDRTVRQIDGFLALARPADPAPVPVELGTLFEHLSALLATDARDTGVRITSDGAGLRVLADETLLRRALLNLLLNALHACENGGSIRLEAGTNGAGAWLRVADTGAGIAPEDLPHVTEPYFTRFSGGTGLGLALVEQIARSHGWRLVIDSAPGNGTTVSIHGLATVA